jgi:hypothetical protein
MQHIGAGDSTSMSITNHKTNKTPQMSPPNTFPHAPTMCGFLAERRKKGRKVKHRRRSSIDTVFPCMRGRLVWFKKVKKRTHTHVCVVGSCCFPAQQDRNSDERSTHSPPPHTPKLPGNVKTSRPISDKL